MTGNHYTDSQGNPAGGTTYGRGFAIGWQCGPLGTGDDRREPNGAFVEDIIEAAIDRLQFYEQSRFASHYNREALAALHVAKNSLRQRTIDRETRGVEGTHEP